MRPENIFRVYPCLWDVDRSRLRNLDREAIRPYGYTRQVSSGDKRVSQTIVLPIGLVLAMYRVRATQWAERLL